MFKFILVCTLTFCGSSSGLYLKHSSNDFLDLLKDIANLDNTEASSDLDQMEPERIIPEDDCKFDTSSCKDKNDDDCFLGYQTNEIGCVVSCECKKDGLFEGDIRVYENDLADLEGIYGLSESPRAASKYMRRWDNLPTSDGTYNIPYIFTESVNDSPRTKLAIKAAMAEYAKLTCIRFITRTDETDYIAFFRGLGCYSSIGRSRGRQNVSIGRGCDYKGVVMHELMHVMGFWHEHARPDRDDYVTVMHQNIRPRLLMNFRKMPARYVDSMGSPYDVNSIMQYQGYAFSKNRQPTMVLKGTKTPTKGQRRGFSEQDLFQLNKMYSCTSKK